MLLNCSFLFFIYLKLKLSEQFVVSNDEGKIIFLEFNDLIIYGHFTDCLIIFESNLFHLRTYIHVHVVKPSSLFIPYTRDKKTEGFHVYCRIPRKLMQMFLNHPTTNTLEAC